MTLQRANLLKQFKSRIVCRPLLLCLLVISVSHRLVADDPADSPFLAKGAKIYRSQCASCHGEKGEGGTEHYVEPLIGDASRMELAKLIADTMPEDNPESCVGEDADAVAAYIYESFYSEAAQVRSRPPRVGLARLTGPQLRQSIADLYTHFSSVPKVTAKRGVKAIYFDGAKWKNENKKMERIDPQIQFDFGHDAPVEGVDPKAFYIYWEGGILAEKTGRYEIVVRSTCSFVMDFGKLGRQLINNHVQSGDKTEFRTKVMLTAGRVYPFKIDFIQRERKTERPPARFSLSWITPNGTEQIIPSRNLISEGSSATFSLQTELPPDDRSYGFERGVAINRQWDESTTSASLEFAQIASEELWRDYRKKQKKEKDQDENRSLLRSFLTEIVETAFRAPLDDEQKKRYIDDQIDATEDDGEAIQRSLLLSLKSPRFLYPLADQEQSRSVRQTNRLTLTLFDSLPSEDWLIKKIRKNEFESENAIRGLAKAFVKDYRTQAKMLDMLNEWLNTKRFGEITKSETLFPGFDRELANDLHDSLDAFLAHLVSSETSDYRQLFMADWTYTTDRLAAFYGSTWNPLDTADIAVAADAEKTVATKSPLPRLRISVSDPEHRFGVLSHPFLMSGMAYHDTTSPIHRGVFLIRNVLGRTLRPPNEAFSPLSPDLHPNLTTRERVTLQTSPDACQVCHSKINGLGFALENFDAVGRFRTDERAIPLNASGKYLARDGKEVSFSGPRELADYIVHSEDATRAFVNRAFQHFVKQPAAAFGPTTLDNLMDQFQRSNCNINELVTEIAVIAATRDPALTKPASTK